MKRYSQEFFEDWLSDNISDLRKEWAEFNPDEFVEYCKEQFNKYCEDNE